MAIRHDSNNDNDDGDDEDLFTGVCSEDCEDVDNNFEGDDDNGGGEDVDNDGADSNKLTKANKKTGRNKLGYNNIIASLLRTTTL